MTNLLAIISARIMNIPCQLIPHSTFLSVLPTHNPKNLSVLISCPFKQAQKKLREEKRKRKKGERERERELNYLASN